tara:strand:- start:29 stop:994 length:966 start_codon:yes stop_codon:yes gene_type:complete
MGIRSFNQGEAYFDRFARTRDGGTGTATEAVSATGGTKFTSGDFTYHFYVNDAFAPQPSSNKEFTLSSGTSINVLLIGGGAGGQNDGGGGGGAGGVAHAENMPVSPGTFVATVGRGKSYNDSPNTTESSTFVDPSGPTTITALGGGHGRDSTTGEAGGSGGGGGQPNNSGGAGNQPGQNPGLPYVSNYGFAGGQGGPSDQGGGGGGAGETGFAGSPGVGGNGRNFSFMPGPQLYTDMPSPLQSVVGTAWRDALGSDGRMAGGGGGGSSSPASGGVGGGGDGGTSQGNGVNYTGSGAGGGPSSPNEPGGTGGNGIIVVYYPT